jgi:hypothetical protein
VFGNAGIAGWHFFLQYTSVLSCGLFNKRSTSRLSQHDSTTTQPGCMTQRMEVEVIGNRAGYLASLHPSIGRPGEPATD